MRRSGFGRALVSVCAASVILAGCGAAEPASVSAPLDARQQSRISPAGANPPCGGDNYVLVTPCPVRLKHQKDGVVVTVSGPGVVSTKLISYDACETFCTVKRDGTSELKWVVQPGQNCGKTALEFEGYNASNGLVGLAYLGVRNSRC